MNNIILTAGGVPNTSDVAGNTTQSPEMSIAVPLMLIIVTAVYLGWWWYSENV